MFILAVRKDSAEALGRTDGDYTPILTDGDGKLWCNVGTIALPSGASTEAKQDTLITSNAAIKTAVELIDDAVGTDGSTGPTKAISIAGTESGGNLQEIAVDSSGNVQVDVLGVVPGTGATNLGKVEDAAHSSGDVGVMALAVRKDTPAAAAADGDYEALRTDEFGQLRVAPLHTGQLFSGYGTATASTTSDVEVVAAVANKTHCVTDITITVLGGANDDCTIFVKSGTTVKFATGVSAASTSGDNFNVTSINLTSPMVMSTNEAVNVQLVDNDCTTIYWTVSGYTIKD